MKLTPPGAFITEATERLPALEASTTLRQWFARVSDELTRPNRAASGATADRPTRDLYAGRMFFDTDLGRPIWYDAAASDWVDADGNSA